MVSPILIGALAAVTFLAYAVKAATGFGPALVVVSLGSVLVGPGTAIVLAAFLDLVSGAGVLWLDRARRDGGWRALAVTVSVGAVIGSLLLGVVPTGALTGLVAAGIIAFGLWMLVPASTEKPARPGRERGGRLGEHLAVGAAGLSGGLLGVGGPPLVIYFGARLSKEGFRALIVPILLAAAVFRVATYAATGQVDREILVLLLASLPALPLGLALGNRLFHRLSERAFRIAVGLLVTAAGVRLLL